MTHEPDIIRSKTYYRNMPNGTKVALSVTHRPEAKLIVPDGWFEFSDLPVLPDTRFTYDGTQDDHGDQHQERA